MQLPKQPQLMTSQELEAEIRKHREYVKGLIAEARARRAEEGKKPAQEKVSSKEQHSV